MLDDRLRGPELDLDRSLTRSWVGFLEITYAIMRGIFRDRLRDHGDADFADYADYY